MNPKETSRPVRTYYLLGWGAILHSALLLLRATVTLPAVFPWWSVSDEFWIALVVLWFLWPLVMVLHPGRSRLRFAAPIFVSLLLLAPCGRYYYWLVEQELHSGPSPTPNKPIVVKEEELGSGFRRVALTEFMKGGFEGTYHGEYLFYRNRKLGSFSSASVSPSRQFAIYRELYSDRLILFRAVDQKTIDLLPPASDRNLEQFEWNEAAGYVALRSSSEELRTFPLK